MFGISAMTRFGSSFLVTWVISVMFSASKTVNETTKELEIILIQLPSTEWTKCEWVLSVNQARILMFTKNKWNMDVVLFTHQINEKHHIEILNIQILKYMSTIIYLHCSKNSVLLQRKLLMLSLSIFYRFNIYFSPKCLLQPDVIYF